MISIKGLHKFFNKGKSNEIHVINDVNLELEERGITAIFGKSGCGKTTLLNVIGGLDGFADGSVTVDGKRISPNTDATRNAYIGYIFQNYNLNMGESCYDNVADALRLVGMRDESEIEARVTAALRAVDMEKFGKRTPDTLSGGQMQRIAIARAIVKNPRIILADEPTGNLDEANTVMIMDLLKAISKDHLVLLVTHEANLVDYYCDTVIELSDGKVESVRRNESALGYSARSKNDIWLGELPMTEIESDGAKIEFFGDAPVSPINLRIVNSGGKIYLKINTDKVQILDDTSEVKLREGSYEEAARRSEGERSIDMSALPPLEGERYGKLFSFKSSVKSGFNDGYRARRFGGKLLRRVMTLFAAVMVSMSAIFGGSIGKLIEVKRSYNHNAFYVYTDIETSHLLSEAVGKPDTGIDYIRLYGYYPSGDETISFRAPSFESFTQNYNFDSLQSNAIFLATELAEGIGVIAGKSTGLSDADMLITKKVADDLIESSSLGYIEDYDDLLGLISSSFKVNGRYPSIAGVIDSAESCVYMSELGLAKRTRQSLTVSNVELGSEHGMTIADGEVQLAIRYRSADVDYPKVGETVTIQGKTFTVSRVRERFQSYNEYLDAKGLTYYDSESYMVAAHAAAYPDIEYGTDEYYTSYDAYFNEHYFDYYDYFYAELDEYLADYYYFEPTDYYCWLLFEKGIKAMRFLYADLDYYGAHLFREQNGRYPTLEEFYSYEFRNVYDDLNEVISRYENEFYSVDRYNYNYYGAVYSLSDADYITLSKQIGETHPSAKQGFFHNGYFDAIPLAKSETAGVVIGGDVNIDYYGMSLVYTLVHSTDPALTLDWLNAHLDPDTGNDYYERLITPDTVYKNLVASETDGIITGIVIISVTALLLSVCMYFIMRSSLMSRIKEVGIYRAIGVSRRNLTFRFFIESAVLTSLTVLIGYAVTAVFITVSLSLSTLVSSILYFPLWYAGAVLVLLLAISLFFGTLPIRTLLRKTPSEILAKYDI